MFPTAPYPKTVLPKFWDLGLTPTKRICFGQETCPNRALGKLWDRLAQNWCPTNINDFKHSINRPSARPREQDCSRIARVLLAPCSRAARARSTSSPPRVAPALRGPALRAPAVRGPAVRAHKIESQGPTFRSSLGVETPDSAEA
jgi:hypothetical protein